MSRSTLQPSNLGALLLGLGSSVVLGMIVGQGALTVATAAALLLFVLAVAALVRGRSRHGTLLHPCLIIGGFLVFYGVLGYFIYPLVWERGPAPLMATIGEAGELRGLVAFELFGLAMLAVAAVAPQAEVAVRAFRIDLGEQHRRVRFGVMLFLVAVPLVFLAGANVPALIHRSTYHGFIGTGLPEAMRLANSLLIPAALVAWTVFFGEKTSHRERTISVICLGAYALLELATSSRGFGVIPLLSLAGYGLARGRLPSLKLVIPTAVLSLLFISAALYLRSGPDQGLLPYLRVMAVRPEAVFVSRTPDVLANLFSGFQLTSTVISRASNIDSHAFWISVNPLPSRSLETGAGTEYHLVAYMPDSTVGILGRLGWIVGTAYFLVLGTVLAWLWHMGHRTVRRANVARPLLSGVAMILCLMLVQYDLRTTNRIATITAILVPVLLVALGGRAGSWRDRLPIGRVASQP